MRHSLIGKIIGILFFFPLSINSALSNNIESQFFSNQLEAILNQKKYNLMKELFLQKSYNKFNQHYLNFREKYKDAKWSVKTISVDKNYILLDIKIKSSREINDQIYNLNTKQTLEIKTFKNKIKSYRIINEESILNSEKSPLIIKVISPDKVLTGERYEINLIVERPLDTSLIASGMIVLNNTDNINISNYPFGIQPNQSGGLFKYIQAPLEPGFQTISAIITHPKGIYSFTKKIKVGL